MKETSGSSSKPGVGADAGKLEVSEKNVSIQACLEESSIGCASSSGVGGKAVGVGADAAEPDSTTRVHGAFLRF